MFPGMVGGIFFFPFLFTRGREPSVRRKKGAGGQLDEEECFPVSPTLAPDYLL